MNNCAFIDTFTTQNDLFGKNNVPFMFRCEIFSETEAFNRKFLLNPSRKLTINLTPDEDILHSGYVDAGFDVETVKDAYFNSDKLDIKTGLQKIYLVLDNLIKKGVYIIGYNHTGYDLGLINNNCVRVLGVEPLNFDENKIIDVMAFAQSAIPVTEIGRYATDIVMSKVVPKEVYSNLLFDMDSADSLGREMLKVKLIFSYLSENNNLSSLPATVNFINDNSDPGLILSFGKYKGLTID